MTNISIFTDTSVGVRVGSATMAAAPVQIARDYLAGYTDDYYFFQLSDSDYCLLLGSGFTYYSESGTVVTPDEFTAVIISELVEHGEPETVTDTFSGTLIGTEESVFRGSYVSEQPSDQTVYVMQSASFSQSTSVINPASGEGYRYIVYGSMDGLPSLISGGDHFAFAQTFIFLVFAAFVLCDRIFRHIRN